MNTGPALYLAAWLLAVYLIAAGAGAIVERMAADQCTAARETIEAAEDDPSIDTAEAWEIDARCVRAGL